MKIFNKMKLIIQIFKNEVEIFLHPHIQTTDFYIKKEQITKNN